jgi:hypothetical protein
VLALAASAAAGGCLDEAKLGFDNPCDPKGTAFDPVACRALRDALPGSGLPGARDAAAPDGAVGEGGDGEDGGTPGRADGGRIPVPRPDAAVGRVDAGVADRADAAAPPDRLDAAVDPLPVDAEIPPPIDAEIPPPVDAERPPPLDMGVPDVPPGRTPCERGDGWTLWRFHYSNNGGSPRIEVWDAACDYSIAPGSACNVQDICRGAIGCEVGRTNTGAAELDGSEYLQIRFSVAGLQFREAWVHLQGRSMSVGASTTYEVWSPLYGAAEGGPVDNDFVYDWYVTDWTGFLNPGDDPGLTAVRITPLAGARSLGVQAMELCVR